jgi:hypothetical protein
MPGFLALASAAVSLEECFSELFHLQREGLGACETGFPTAQGRGRKLVTEEPKPVGSAPVAFRPDTSRPHALIADSTSRSPIFFLLA